MRWFLYIERNWLTVVAFLMLSSMLFHNLVPWYLMDLSQNTFLKKGRRNLFFCLVLTEWIWECREKRPSNTFGNRPLLCLNINVPSSRLYMSITFKTLYLTSNGLVLLLWGLLLMIRSALFWILYNLLIYVEYALPHARMP